MPDVLLIEDDARVRASLEKNLARLGHRATSVETGMEGLHTALEAEPDVVVLDLGLPDVDGSALLRMLRGVSDVPVLVASARDDEDEITGLLHAGADDYVVKPFTAGQLDARIRAILRRTQPRAAAEAISVGPLRVDADARRVELEGRPVDLAPKEFDLLLYLARRAGSVVAKRDIVVDVWRLPYGGADKTVDVHLAWLRRKLGESATNPRLIHTVRGVGVKLEAVEGAGAA
ncbi:response regulator transcription factor [Salininema proteolyticum]|uniref:Response regulator transcription factor n=1 Tax=Salininema proteolyticum TaxID=1607685 RepID=A0ABV8TSU8_9ACTN